LGGCSHGAKQVTQFYSVPKREHADTEH
jgi:hypothetical protein